MNAVWGLMVMLCMGVSGYDYQQCKYEEVQDTAVIMSVAEAPNPAYGFEVTYRLELLEAGERTLRPASCPYVCAEDLGRYNIRVGATFPAVVKRRVSGSCPELVVKFPSLKLQGAGTVHASLF